MAAAHPVWTRAPPRASPVARGPRPPRRGPLGRYRYRNNKSHEAPDLCFARRPRHVPGLSWWRRRGGSGTPAWELSAGWETFLFKNLGRRVERRNPLFPPRRFLHQFKDAGRSPAPAAPMTLPFLLPTLQVVARGPLRPGPPSPPEDPYASKPASSPSCLRGPAATRAPLPTPRRVPGSLGPLPASPRRLPRARPAAAEVRLLPPPRLVGPPPIPGLRPPPGAAPSSPAPAAHRPAPDPQRRACGPAAPARTRGPGRAFSRAPAREGKPRERPRGPRLRATRKWPFTAGPAPSGPVRPRAKRALFYYYYFYSFFPYFHLTDAASFPETARGLRHA